MNGTASVARSEVSHGLPDGRVEIDGKFFRAGGRRFFVRGVTYGPFRPAVEGEPFPSAAQVSEDFRTLRTLGVNTVRTFTPPPLWLLDEAQRAGLRVIVGIPWAQHVCFLEQPDHAADALERVAGVAAAIGHHPSLFALLIGNETPPDVVRWEGPPRVERFLEDLADTAHQHAPDALVSYANFPPTEYLDLGFLDFLSFNVYLHREADLRRYLARLQNLADERPLVLTELGFDSARSSEAAQAETLSWQLDTAFTAGAAGAVVFSYTDEWFSLDRDHPDGGFSVDDWAFGLVDGDRRPKAAFETVRSRFTAPLPPALEAPPLVSVVVCAFNEERTIGDCLASLTELAYPRFEVVVVNDGSTDGTPRIADAHASAHVRVIHQPNGGLSAARNRGIAEAQGDIVAFTDADCVVDADWLTYLVSKLREGHVAVGGPNLSPRGSGLVPSVVAAAPGVPTHVLLDDDVAEHVPGCNMAFERPVLEEIGGFRETYRVAGDDVDVCWRLQDAGYTIAFSPAAVVWHFRRESVGAYLRQQRGYGRAEALLSRDHPLRFNALGQSRWLGRVYGGLVDSIVSRRPRIYHGLFGEGLFQTLYEDPSSALRHLPLTLEWNVVAWMLLWIGMLSGDLLRLAALPLAVTAFTVVSAATRARLAPPHDGLPARGLLAVLTYLGPLVRSVERSRDLLRRRNPAERATDESRGALVSPAPSVSWTKAAMQLSYWSESSTTKSDFFAALVQSAEHRPFRVRIDSGWNDWDLEVAQGAWTQARVQAAVENHGGRRRLVRVRIGLHPAPVALGAIAACVGTVVAGLMLDLPAFARTGALFGLAATVVVVGQNVRLGRAVGRVVNDVAHGLGLTATDGRAGR